MRILNFLVQDFLFPEKCVSLHCKNNKYNMALSYGFEREPWMNKESHNRHYSFKKMKRERNKKIRRLPLEFHINLKKRTGWEW